MTVQLRSRTGARITWTHDALIPLAGGVALAVGGLSAISWQLSAAALGALLLVWATYQWPRAYLAVLCTVLMLVPITAGLQLSASLPVVFPSRPIVAIGLATIIIGAASWAMSTRGTKHRARQRPR